MQTKVCTKCGIEYPATNEYFNRSKNYNDGFSYYCKTCISEYKKEYYQKNKNIIKTNATEYRNNNKNKISEYKKEYYIKNKDKFLDYYKKYKENNIEKLLEYKRNWYLKNKNKIKKEHKKYYLANKEKYLLRAKKYAINNPEKTKKYKKKYLINNIEKCKLATRKYSVKNKDKIKKRSALWKKENKDKVNISTQKRYAKKKKLKNTFNEKQWIKCKKYFNHRCAYCGVEEFLTQDHFIPLSKNGEYTKNNIVPACKSCNSKKHNKNFFEWYPKQEFYSKEKENKILKYLNYNPKTKIQQSALI